MRDQQLDLSPGRLVGYRKWLLRRPPAGDGRYRLASITADAIWPWTPQVRAHCRRAEIGARVGKFRYPVEHDPEDVPNAACSCGIYASYRLPRISSYDMTYVSGVIEAWGPTIVGENAFRARHARLVALCVPHEGVEIAGDLGQLYRVPIYVDQDQMKHDHPASDVSELLPPIEPVPAEISTSRLQPIDPDPRLAFQTRCWCGNCVWRKRNTSSIY